VRKWLCNLLLTVTTSRDSRGTRLSVSVPPDVCRYRPLDLDLDLDLVHKYYFNQHIISNCGQLKHKSTISYKYV
jgi:hypothetical protein